MIMIRATCLEEFEACFDLSSVNLGLTFDGLDVESFLSFTFFEDGEAQLFDLNQRAIKRLSISDGTIHTVRRDNLLEEKVYVLLKDFRQRLPGREACVDRVDNALAKPNCVSNELSKRLVVLQDGLPIKVNICLNIDKADGDIPG